MRRVLWVDLFSSIEVQQVAAKEYVQWVWSDGDPAPGLGELTIVDSVLSSVLGPVVQKPVNTNPRLKINQGAYFSTPKCCSTLIFGKTLH